MRHCASLICAKDIPGVGIDKDYSAYTLRAFVGHHLCFCLSFSLPKYISARIKLRVPILVAQKRIKNGHSSFLGGFRLCLFRIFSSNLFLVRSEIKKW